MNDTEPYRQAKWRVACLRRFYTHLATFFIVGGALFFICVATGGGLWIFWPLGIWGFILAVHAVRLFLINPALGPAWEERKIKEYMDESGQLAGTALPTHGD